MLPPGSGASGIEYELPDELPDELPAVLPDDIDIRERPSWEESSFWAGSGISYTCLPSKLRTGFGSAADGRLGLRIGTGGVSFFEVFGRGTGGLVFGGAGGCLGGSCLGGNSVPNWDLG